MNDAFFYGLILAFGLILPLGVQNIFIFNQGASQQKIWHAFPSVLTAFICDTILILLSILGVSVAVFSITWLKTILFTIGFFFLIYMGWHTWNNAAKPHTEGKPLSTKQQIIFVMSISLLNPHAIIDTVSVIGTNSLHFMGDEKIAFTTACLLVSFLWFLSLSMMGYYVKTLDQFRVYINIINKLSALIIWGIGMYLAYQLVTDALAFN